MGFPKLPRFITDHKLATIIVVGIFVRLVLMPISAHPFDGYVWYDISTHILNNSPLHVEAFPPLWYRYMMIPVAYSYSWLSGFFSSGAIPLASIPSELNFYPALNIQYVPGMLFNTIVKIPFLISDILLTLLLYKIVEELTKNKGLAEKAAFFWFLNPFVIWVSAGWGMWDTIPALLSLAALFFLMKKKILLSAVCISLGVASKLYLVLFLVPILIYLFKTSEVGDKLKNCLKFFSLFAFTSIILLLPYLGMVTSFLTRYILPNPATIVNPVIDPLGFGLTYWSLSILNRILNVSFNSGFVSYISVASVVFVVLILLAVYWKTGKMTFQNPIIDLALILLLPIFSLFLTYRIICEQWVVWALPFLIILCLVGRVRGAFYWVASAVALLYSILNCPLPFFFLPLAPWYTDVLLGMVNSFWQFETIRIVVLAILGCAFSILLILMLIFLRKKPVSQTYQF